MAMVQTPATLPDLAAIREAKGIRLSKIAETTKISVRYLKAIESGDFKLLPGGVFATNYIRQYAQAIDYDEWDLLACYRSAMPEPESVPEAADDSRRGLVPALLRILIGRA